MGAVPEPGWAGSALRAEGTALGSEIVRGIGTVAPPRLVIRPSAAIRDGMKQQLSELEGCASGLTGVAVT